MTHKPSPRPRPIALDVARADDRLLDALGQGEPAPQGDQIATLLASWRAELVDDLSEDLAEEPLPAPVPRRSAWSGWRVRLVAAAALASLATAGTSLAAVNAEPGSPLWPVTRVINPDRADVLDAQTTIDQARRAIIEGRQADARRLLDQAQDQIARVRDPSAAQRLRAELDALRQSLTGLVTGATSSAPGVGPLRSPGSTGGGGSSTGTGGGGATPTPTPTAGSTGGTGGGTGGGGGILPTGVPSLPLPSLPSLPPILK